MNDVRGWTAAEFSPVADAVASNLHVGEELGCSVAVCVNGELVVDLHAGWRDREQTPYEADALQLVFSTTKGVTAICVAALVDEGLLDLDAPVSRYWPEFAAEDKGRITVRQLASHQAGLPAFDTQVLPAELALWDARVAQLASQRPRWAPGTAHGYHAITSGFLLGEVVRRVSGQSLGQYLSRRFVGPLGLDVYVGAPKSILDRVVPLVDAPSAIGDRGPLRTAELTPGTLTNAALSNPPTVTEVYNDSALWECEIPAANGITDARSLAMLYSTVVSGTRRQISPETVAAMSVAHVDGPDLVLVDQPTKFGAGFMLSAPREPMLSRDSFGHNGRGGSLAFADPGSGVAYAFVTNHIVNDPAPDRRNTRILAALRDCLR